MEVKAQFHGIETKEAIQIMEKVFYFLWMLGNVIKKMPQDIILIIIIVMDFASDIQTVVDILIYPYQMDV